MPYSEPTEERLAWAKAHVEQRVRRFRCGVTEYGDSDEDSMKKAQANSDAQWVAHEWLRADVPDWWRKQAWEWWVASAAETPTAMVLTPEVLIRHGIDDWKKDQLRTHRLAMETIYVNGRADPHERMSAGRYHSTWWKKLRERSLERAKIALPPRATHNPYCAQVDPIYADGGTLKGYAILVRPWLPATVREDQIEAHDYSKECARIQASKAGRKAKRILMDNLTDDQQETYYRHGWIIQKSEKGRFYGLLRGFPNGNILLLGAGWKVLLNFCYHPEEPYALDDILLTQKLMVEHHEEEFIETANAGGYRGDGLNLRTAPFDLAYEQDIHLSGAAR